MKLTLTKETMMRQMELHDSTGSQGRSALRVFTLCLFLLVSFVMAGCSTTEKVGGEGMTSAVAQNLLRIAAVRALEDANWSPYEGQTVYLHFSGARDARNEPVLRGLVEDRLEQNGARVVSDDELAEIDLEVRILIAGTDRGSSRVPVLRRSERNESIVDLEFRGRRNEDRMALQSLYAMSKYEQSVTLGFQGRGAYFVRGRDDSFRRIQDINLFR